MLRDRPHRLLLPLGVLLALTPGFEPPTLLQYLVLLDLWCRLSSMLGLSGGVSGHGAEVPGLDLVVADELPAGGFWCSDSAALFLVSSFATQL